MADDDSGELVIIKPETDNRSYKYIELQNGLCALIVQDAREKDAAAAMCVKTGSFSDPKDIQGAAHLLEHLLFRGTKGSEFKSFLGKHGGDTNAETEREYTLYSFSCNNECLKGALARFSKFFTNPSFHVNDIKKEIRSIDEEFHGHFENDATRLEQLQCHTSADGHPFQGFSWGSWKSFRGAVHNEAELKTHLKQLFEDHYHASNMKLVVAGGEPLGTLENWVRTSFRHLNVKVNPIQSIQVNPVQSIQVNPVQRIQPKIWEAKTIYWLEGVKDGHQLTLSWVLPPPLQGDYLEKADKYIDYLLGHEGKGSLFHLLKYQRWATAIEVGVGNKRILRTSFSHIFVMTLELTDSGVEKISEIIGFVYQFIKLLREKGPSQWVFKELQECNKVDFRFMEEIDQVAYAESLAEGLLLYPPKHVIYGPYAYDTWKPESIVSFGVFQSK